MPDSSTPLQLAHDLTLAWLENPQTRASTNDVSAFLVSMHQGVTALAAAPPIGESASQSEPSYTPAVSVKKSLADPTVIISLLDGKPYKTLKRHLSANGLTPADYRQRFNLPADYPMTAPAYSSARSEISKKLGLGRKPGQKAPTKAVEGKAAPKARKSIGEAKRAAQAHLGYENSLRQ